MGVLEGLRGVSEVFQIDSVAFQGYPGSLKNVTGILKGFQGRHKCSREFHGV